MAAPRRFVPLLRRRGGHNGPMRMVRVAAVGLGLAVLLTACGGNEEPKDPETSATQGPGDQNDVTVPEGVTLTEYGTELKFGESATVAYAPNEQRKTVLDLTVVSATKGTIADLAGYTLEERTRQSTPYYVRVKVKNVGVGDVGKTLVPLFLVDNRNTLISASSFTNSFAKCPSTPLPTTFAPNAEASTCLVYLAPDKGTLTGVSFRAVQEFAPIVWTGTVTEPKAPAKKKNKAS